MDGTECDKNSLDKCIEGQCTVRRKIKQIVVHVALKVEDALIKNISLLLFSNS